MKAAHLALCGAGLVIGLGGLAVILGAKIFVDAAKAAGIIR